MLRRLLCISAATILLTSGFVRAETIDDFTFAEGSHIVTFSLPASFSFPDQLHLLTIPCCAATPGALDGVAGYTVATTFFSGEGSSLLGGTLFLSIYGGPGPDANYGLYEAGSVVEPTFLPGTAAGVDTGTFVPGTYLGIGSPEIGAPPASLSITPASTTAATPEPATFSLLGIGCVGLLARHWRSLS